MNNTYHIFLRTFNIIFLICLFVALYLIAHSKTVLNRKEEKKRREFWTRENEANFVRKKDISNLDYVIIPIELLPMAALLAAQLEDIHKKIMELSNKKIINLSKFTNTDLKMEYGPANLTDLSEYDENYTSLIRLLHKAGSELSNAGDDDSAIAFLDYSVSIGSDMSNTFELLGTLYNKQNKTEELDKLISKAESLNSLTKNMIMNKLNNIKTL